MKYINFKRYKFSTIVKKLDTILLNLNSFLRVLINGFLYPILKSYLLKFIILKNFKESYINSLKAFKLVENLYLLKLMYFIYFNQDL